MVYFAFKINMLDDRNRDANTETLAIHYGTPDNLESWVIFMC